MRGLFDNVPDIDVPPTEVLTPRAKFSPRDYQQEGIDKAFHLFDEGHIGVMFRQPTGTGKTVSGTMIADLWLQRGPEYRVLVVAHERQLIQQFANEVYDILGMQPAIEMGAEHQCSGNNLITIGSRASLYKSEGEGDSAVSRLYKFRPEYNWLLIIDEAHRWKRSMPSCKPIIEWFEKNPMSRRLGLTATPERSDKVSLKGLFSGIASDYRLFDIDGGRCAVNDGWAVPYDQRFIVVEGVDFKNLHLVGKDFDKNELAEILGESETLAKLCDPLMDIVGRRRTIIFSPVTAMARDVALYINSRMEHTAAMSLDGEYPDDLRQQIYRQHQRGDFQFLSVCGLCREGYNDPGIGCVAVFRPTKSRGLAEQMKGRGCRPLRGTVSVDMTATERRAAIAASDKPSCLIVDLVGVTGLGDCPSTASIMAEGKPDEVIARANAAMLNKSPNEPSDVATEVRKAEAAINEEKRVAAKKALENRQREMNRRSKIKTDTRYHQTQVGHGGGGAGQQSQNQVVLATPKHIGWLKWKGVTCDLTGLTQKEARRMSAIINNGGKAGSIERQVKPGQSGSQFRITAGPYKGTPLKQIPFHILKEMGKTVHDPEFQRNITLYREEWKREHPKKD